MSVSAAIRRRKQAKMGYKHLAPQQRPLYKRKALASLNAAIEAERRRAAREASRKAKK